MHFDALMVTKPVDESRPDAPVGQAATQLGSSHLEHPTGTLQPARSRVTTLIREKAGEQTPSWVKEQIISQFRHPTHL
jgi:hypothetical protein